MSIASRPWKGWLAGLPIQFACPRCMHESMVARKFAGRAARCPSCGSRLRIPTPVSEIGEQVQNEEIEFELLETPEAELLPMRDAEDHSSPYWANDSGSFVLEPAEVAEDMEPAKSLAMSDRAEVETELGEEGGAPPAFELNDGQPTSVRERRTSRKKGLPVIPIVIFVLCSLVMSAVTAIVLMNKDRWTTDSENIVHQVDDWAKNTVRDELAAAGVIISDQTSFRFAWQTSSLQKGVVPFDATAAVAGNVTHRIRGKVDMPQRLLTFEATPEGGGEKVSYQIDIPDSVAKQVGVGK